MLVSIEETWLAPLPWVSKNPSYLPPQLNVTGGFFLLSDVTMDISRGKFISGKSSYKHHANFPR